MVAATLDPDGRRVVLDENGWRHIKRRHPQLATALREIMSAVREPDQRKPGRIPGEEWFFLQGGVTRWIHVVVHYEQDRGRIVTAFPRSWPE